MTADVTQDSSSHYHQSLSIVVPLYNEEENVNLLVNKIKTALTDYAGSYEIILVNDGSTDGTLYQMKQCRSEIGRHIQVLDLSRNFGQTAAMQAGLDYSTGEFVATMDGDLQNDPADLPRMIQELQDRDLDLIQGWRKDRKDGLVLRKIPSSIANRLIARLTGLKLHDYGCSLKVYRGSVIRKIRLYGEMHRFIPIWATGVTSPHRVGETVVTHHPRQFGESKYGISRTFRVIIDLLSVFFFQRFKSRPSHFFGAIGLFFGCTGGLMLTWLLIVKFGFGSDIGNRPMLFISILFIMMSIQFMTTGVISEMLSRIYFTQDNQNSYFISEHSETDNEPHFSNHSR
ncbi:MAG: glycosyltransferase family 2 protein [Reinekea sp.]